MQFKKKFWQEIKRGENLDLYLTILVAFSVGILDIIGVAPETWVTPIILTVLGLLAISALKNDYRNQELLQKLSKTIGNGLRSRTQMQPLHTSVQSASEIFIVAVSGISLFTVHFGVFERKLREGCKLNVLLLKPGTPAVQVWDIGVRGASTELDINNSLIGLKELSKIEKKKGLLQVRLLSVFPPFTIFAIDPRKNTGSMVVELHLFKTPVTDRPHIFLNQVEDQKWFDTFLEQIDKMWLEAEVWNPLKG